MTVYTLRIECQRGTREEHKLAFEDDTAAIFYALPIVQGKSLQILRGDTLIATVDERPCA